MQMTICKNTFGQGVLKGHNRANVHITCYQLQSQTDERTKRLKDLSDGWCVPSRLKPLCLAPCPLVSDAPGPLGCVRAMVAEMTADAIADKIRSDKIDILVELGGHTASCRLDAVALCPAPILVSWIG
jgi:predicted O-linked N-acetylglucosamine transferase (SPINDLY family)